MQRPLLTTVSLALLVSVCGCRTTPPRPQARVSASAIVSLEAMGKRLQQLPVLSYSAHELVDVQMADGHWMQVEGRSRLSMARPDRLTLTAEWGPQKARLWFGDGVLTLVDVTRNHVATLDVDGDLDACLDRLGADLSMPLPGHDILYEEPLNALLLGVREGRDLGDAMIDGATCSHLGFTLPEFHWEIWIDDETHLPRRFVMTDMQSPDQPQYAVELSDWALTPVADSAFLPQVPATATPLPIDELLQALEETP